MQLLLSRWLRRGATVSMLVASACQASAPHEALKGRHASVFANGKGVSLAGAVWAVRSPGTSPSFDFRAQPERWSWRLLNRLKSSGFGIVRLMTSPVPLMTDEAAAKQRALSYIEKLVDEGNKAGLTTIVDLHFWPTDKPLWQDNVVADTGLRERLMKAQVSVAKYLSDHKTVNVVLELLNEPPCYVNKVPIDWPAIQQAMVERVRTVAPSLPLLLTGCRGLPKSLTAIDATPYGTDPNINWTFHYYEPSPFVGQENAKLNSVPFPPVPSVATSETKLQAMAPQSTVAARPATLRELRTYLLQNHGRSTIAADMADINRWAARYGIASYQIYVGEFGTMMTNTPASQRVRPDELRWIEAVRGESERAGFSWSYFPLPRRGDLDYDPATNYFKSDTLKALGLSAR